MNSKNSFKPLVELGLTDLESQIYAFLVENSPATGYRIANKISKPTANTYKALRSMQGKGIVIVEDSKPQAFRAVPTAVLLERLEKRFQKMKSLAAAELANLKPAAEDEKVYRLHTADQVFERFRDMLRRGEKFVLLDLFPDAVAELREEIEAAAERGVHVILKLYRPEEIRGCISVVEPTGEEIIAHWPGVAANCFIDGREHLIAFLAPDMIEVYDAIWSRSTLISANFHGALFSEILLMAFKEDRKGRNVPDSKKLKRLLAIRDQGIMGYEILKKRYRENAGKVERE